MKKITEENSDQLQKEEEEIIFLWGAKIFYGLNNYIHVEGEKVTSYLFNEDGNFKNMN
ncbi:hypothetical protein ACMVJ6_11050 [Staphylococcus ureilyticus]|uniref:hypothetical protein n=1 Tax=Staphylococcus ureilyticus TaxID=94138 RepID=UPI0039E1D6DE